MTSNTVVTVAAPTDEKTLAAKRHTDRMSILLQEREEIVGQLKKSQASGDQTAINRNEVNLQAIDREINIVSKQPVYPTKASWPAQGAKPVSASYAVTESRPSEPPTYESWDVFKNFGRKETQP